MLWRRSKLDRVVRMAGADVEGRLVDNAASLAQLAEETRVEDALQASKAAHRLSTAAERAAVVCARMASASSLNKAPAMRTTARSSSVSRTAIRRVVALRAVRKHGMALMAPAVAKALTTLCLPHPTLWSLANRRETSREMS